MSIEITEYIPASKANIIKAIEAVSAITGIEVHNIMSKSRLRDVVLARNMCFSIMRDGLGMTFTSIANHFDKHHATIIFAVKVNDQDLAHSPLYRSRYESILTQLGINFRQQTQYGNSIEKIEENMLRRTPIVIV